MDSNYGLNGNLNYPSMNAQNQFQNNNQVNNKKTKLFNIKETDSFIYIEKSNHNSIIKIPRDFQNKMHLIENQYEYMNVNLINTYECDSIIGILNLNENKYLMIVSTSKVAAKVLGSFLFNILSIDLIKITLNKESITDINAINDIKNLFFSKNFYFSNDFDLSLSLYNQDKINTYDYNGNNSNKKQLKSRYLINSSLLNYFVENNIPESFYSTIIFGYVGCKIDIDLNEDLMVDIIIIERYCKKNVIINQDIPGYVKQIELISNFKNRINKHNGKAFSFIFYVNSESMKSLNEFNPCKSVLIEDFNQFKNITCIINNINNYNDNSQLNNIILKLNENKFGGKIKLVDFTSNWNKSLYFDTNNDSYNFIDFYFKDSLDVVQKSLFWFIDLNNYFSDNDFCFNAFIRFLWKAIQKEINFLNLNIDIGLFSQNNDNNVCNKFKEIIMKYHNDLDENKKTLYNNMNRDNIQETYNNCFINSFNKNKNNINNININNNISYNTSRTFNNNNYNMSNNNYINSNRNKESNINNKKNDNEGDIKKIKLLCVTWNIAGISCKNDYNITEVFTQNIFYHKKVDPDIIVVGIQEIIKLSITSVLSIVSNQENVKAWTENILNTLNRVFPNTNYYQLKCMDLVGIYIIVLIKSSLKNDIYLLDSNTTKTGIYGTMGNKGFFTLTLKCYGNYISFGSGHFEAGQSKNEERIETLKQLLNKEINIYTSYEYATTFKDIEYWIILGDLNFRIDLSFEDAFALIQEKKYDVLYGLDQFNSVKENDRFLKDYIIEKEIKFEPTYKYVKGSNEYAYDEDKVRVPAWTDRIFYCKNKGMKMLTYDSIKTIRYSDHRPVVGSFLIKCINKKTNLNNNKINKNDRMYNPYENIFKEENNNNNNYNRINKNKNSGLIDTDNNNIKDIIKPIKKEGNNLIRDSNSNNDNKRGNKSKGKKNEQQIKMNYRGINFNTEIELNKDNDMNTYGFNQTRKNEQDIYQFYANKQKNNNNTINSQNKNDLIFDSFNNMQNNNFNNFNNNQVINNNNSNNNILDFFQ